MRSMFWQMMVSLDGCMEGPNGESDWRVVDDDFMRYVMRMGKEIDAILFGRVTYQMMASYWPTATIALSDFEDRKHWDEYQKAYEAALSRCSHAWAPWRVIPANRKWVRNLAVSEIIVDTL